MGCNCGGSTPPADKKLAAPQTTRTAAPPTPRRSGGPGEAGYAWNGPPAPPSRKSD